MMFKPVAHDGFDADPVDRAALRADDAPPDDEEIDIADVAEMDDAPPEAPAVDSVSLITQSFGATVVEEVPATSDCDEHDSASRPREAGP